MTQSHGLVRWWSSLFLLVLCLVGLPVAKREVLMSPAVTVRWFISQLSIYLLTFPKCQLSQVQVWVACSKIKTQTRHRHFIPWVLPPLALASFISQPFGAILHLYYVLCAGFVLVLRKKDGESMSTPPSRKKKSFTFSFLLSSSGMPPSH